MLHKGYRECGGILQPTQVAAYCAASEERYIQCRKEYYRTEQRDQINNDQMTHIKEAQIIELSFVPQYHDESRGACVSFFHRIARASLTIEAAIALPLFIFMMFILVFPLKVMEEERRIQNTAESIGKQLASAEYVKSVGSELLNKDGESNEFLENLLGGIEEGAALGIILAKAVSFKSISLPYFGDDTSVFAGDSKDMFNVKLKYEVKLPFNTYTIPSLSRSIVVSRRAWTGSEGGRGRSKYSTDTEGEGDEERRVYLGKTSTVYHEDPNCHYLSNVMQTADVSHMEALRNAGGSKYHACPSCKPGSLGTVYYFDSGTAYHSSEHCKAITAYSRSVPLSEVGDMRACSYCGKAH